MGEGIQGLLYRYWPQVPNEPCCCEVLGTALLFGRLGIFEVFNNSDLVLDGTMCYAGSAQSPHSQPAHPHVPRWLEL